MARYLNTNMQCYLQLKISEESVMEKLQMQIKNTFYLRFICLQN